MAPATYRERPAPPRLAGVVACVWCHEVCAVREQRVLPDGCLDLIWMDGAVHVAGPDTRAFLATLPPDARVGMTDVTAEFGLLPHDGWGVWPSLYSLHTNGAQYALTRSHQLDQGYGYAAPAMLTWLAEHAVPVFTTHGPSDGTLVVWRLDQQAVTDSVDAGQDLPPVTGGYP